MLQHRTKVKPWTGRADRVSVPRNATPEIQPRSERYWGRERQYIQCPYPGRSAWVRVSGRLEGGNDDYADAHAEVGSLRTSEEAGENQWSKGRDGLRKTGHRQLSFVFADSPDGGGEAGVSDASDGRAYLLHKAKRKTTARALACTIPLKPFGDDARISTVLVCRTALRSHEPVAGVEPRGGFRTARFGVLIQRSTEPDAWPAYPVL